MRLLLHFPIGISTTVNKTQHLCIIRRHSSAIRHQLPRNATVQCRTSLSHDSVPEFLKRTRELAMGLPA